MAVGHPFYKALNRLLADAGSDRWIEDHCLVFDLEVDRRGQRSLPPGVHFRRLLVGYFDGISLQRGTAWQCADSLSMREFLGLPLDQGSPGHARLSNARPLIASQGLSGSLRVLAPDHQRQNASVR